MAPADDGPVQNGMSDDDREAIDRAFAELVAGYHLTADRSDAPVSEHSAEQRPPAGGAIGGDRAGTGGRAGRTLHSPTGGAVAPAARVDPSGLDRHRLRRGVRAAHRSGHSVATVGGLVRDRRFRDLVRDLGQPTAPISASRRRGGALKTGLEGRDPRTTATVRREGPRVPDAP